jgi:hypothetical protein
VPALIAAVVAALATTYFASLFAERRELTVQINRANAINNLAGSAGNAFRINISNSGNGVIRSAAIRIVATGADSLISLRVVRTTTRPEFEFGRIDQQSGRYFHRYLVDLLNPTDALELLAVVEHGTGVREFAKADGTKVRSPSGSTRTTHTTRASSRV